MVTVSPALGSAGSKVTELISPSSVGLAGVQYVMHDVIRTYHVRCLQFVTYCSWLYLVDQVV